MSSRKGLCLMTDAQSDSAIEYAFYCIEQALKNGVWSVVNCPKCGHPRYEKHDLNQLEECPECGAPEQQLKQEKFMSDGNPKTADEIVKNLPERWKGLYTALKGLKDKGHSMEQYLDNPDPNKEMFHCKRCGRFATFDILDGKLSKTGSAIGKPCNGVSHKKP